MRTSAVVAAVTLLACSAFSNLAYAQDAAGDPVAGKTVFARCAICHKVVAGQPSLVGPNLFGVSGRKAATMAGFNFSGPLKASGITWTNDKLTQWVSGPAKMVPGTKMAFPGITSKAQARDVVAYLNTLK